MEIAPQRLTLERCLEMAMAHDADIQQGRFDVDLQRTNLREARYAFAPRLSSSYGYARVTTGPRGGTFLDEASGQVVSGLTESTVRRSQDLTVSLRMPLLDLSDHAQAAAARRSLEATRAGLVRTRQDVVFVVKQAFYALLQAERLAQVQEEHVQNSVEDLARMEELQRVGEVALADVWSARAALQTARTQLLVQRGQVDDARYRLAAAIGLPADAELIPEEPMLADVTVPTAEEAEALLQVSPALQALSSSAQQAKESLRATRYATRLPTVAGVAAHRYTLGEGDDFDGVSDLWNRNYATTLAVNVDIPLFDGLVGESEIQRRKIEVRRSQQALDDARQQLRRELRHAVDTVQRIGQMIAAYEDVVAAAMEDARLQQDAYDIGQSTYQQRQQAEQRLLTARLDLVRARYDRQIAAANLDRVLGIADN